MAQQLRALIALPEELFSSQHPWQGLTTVRNSSSRGFSALLASIDIFTHWEHRHANINRNTCCTNNKNPETDIAVQAEDQKKKLARALEKSYLYQDWATAD